MEIYKRKEGEKLIKLTNVSKTYSNGYLALSDVNISLPETGLVMVVGASGSGKSTLANIIAGLDNCDGEMTINNRLINNCNLDEYRCDNIANIFQDYKLIESMSVCDNISLGAMQNKNNKQSEHYFKSLIDSVRLDQKVHYHKRVSKLSGGEKQRVAICRALAKDVPVIIGDEVTANLDKKNSRIIFELLKVISSEKLVIMVTHECKYAQEFADYTIELKDGKIINENLPECNQLLDGVYDTKDRVEIKTENININIHEKTPLINNKNNSSKQENAKIKPRNYNINRAENAKEYKPKSTRINQSLSTKHVCKLSLWSGKGIFTILSMLLVAVMLLISFSLASFSECSNIDLVKKGLRSADSTIVFAQMNKLTTPRKIKTETVKMGGRLAYSETITVPKQHLDLDTNINDAYYYQVIDGELRLETFVMCDNPQDIGLQLIAGTNISDYNQIIISEHVALNITRVGEFKGKMINFYNDLIGVELIDGHNIAGVYKTYYDKSDSEYKNIKYGDFQDGIASTELDMLKSNFQYNIDTRLILIKEDYLEKSAEIDSCIVDDETLVNGAVFDSSHVDINKVYDMSEKYSENGKGLSFETINSWNISEHTERFLDKSIFVLLTVLSSIIVLLLVVMTVVADIRQKRNNIVILRSIGVKSRDMIKVFLISSCVLSLLAIAIGISSYFVILYITSASLIIYDAITLYNIYTFCIPAVIVMSTLVLAVTISSVVIIIKRAFKRSIITELKA